MMATTDVDALREQVLARLADKGVPERRALASRLEETFGQPALAPSDRRAAEELARQLAQDAVELVRVALAQSVRNYGFLPRDIALRIANDVESVAAPFLEATEVFDEADWQQLVLTVAPGALVAVARRRRLSEGLVDILAQVGEAEVAETLVANDNAPLTAPSCTTLMERFPDRPTVLERMARRRELPPEIAVRLIDKVSEAARAKLARDYGIEDFTAPVAVEGRTATLLRIVRSTQRQDLRSFAETLARRGELSPLFLLRALDEGMVDFLEAGLAVRAGIPVENARALVRRGGEEGRAKLLLKAEIPAPLERDFLQAMAGAADD